MDVDKLKSEILDYKNKAKSMGYNLFLVDANPSKGYSYSYFLCYPEKNMGDTLVMNCLNDYEEPFENNEIENSDAIEEIYSLFGEGNRIKPTSEEYKNNKIELSSKNEEEKSKSLSRVGERIKKCMSVFYPFKEAPFMVPLIPGFTSGEMHDNVVSELGKGVAGEIGPQIMNMVKDAQANIKLITGKDLDDKIISYGHSKESTFADHFSALYPEKVKALFLGGTEFATLPIDEIRLIVDDKRNDNEQFEIKDGIPYKKITESELKEIIEEYNRNNSDEVITMNEDNSYSFPMNYPLGIKDIEKYRGNFSNEQEKEKYLENLKSFSRVIFDGEYEEQIDGHYAYFSNEVDNQSINYGDDLDLLDRSVSVQVEKASMHNRVLDYPNSQKVLFGRSANERLRNYMDLSEKLLNTNSKVIQSKIYTNVGHRGIYRNEELPKDLNKLYSGLMKNDSIEELGDNGRAEKINPLFQIIRRYKVSKDIQEYELKSKALDNFLGSDKYVENIGKLTKDVQDYVQAYKLQGNSVNLDKIYDTLTQEEINSIFSKVISYDKAKENENISMKSVVLNAMSKNTSFEEVSNSNTVENREKNEQQIEGATKNDE